ncbi:MAG: hypothetical protein Kow00121_02970 [Elainellaceae cyanobacterium]
MRRIQNKRVRVASQDARIFVFGDSLSDTGNFFAATGALFPPSPPYFNGRFSNGPLAVETLARRLGLSVTPETNFASGGARTGRENISDTDVLKLGGLLDQVDRFARIVGSGGANPNALYFVWIGRNDFPDRPADPIAAVNQAVENVKAAVTRLADLGAKNIVVVQNPNFGRTPLSLQAGLFDPLTNITLDFNQGLRTALTPLERNSGLNLILTNLFPLGETIAQNPSGFGFSNVIESYLRDLIPVDPTIDPNQFFFWDQVHPTSRGHDIFANALRQAVISNITNNIDRIGSRLDDNLVGYSGDDLLRGRLGQDTLEGNRGNDSLLGGQGADTLRGQQDNDLLLGGIGNDVLQGGAGRDRLFGQTGQDSLSGGSGVDFLSGGLGDDLLNGGGSCDLFSLRLGRGTDTIQDFESENDLLFLSGRLTLDQLNIRQQGANTVITIASSNQTLAILENVRASSIGSSDFLGERSDRTLLDLANREQGAAILDAIQAESSGLRSLLQTQ